MEGQMNKLALTLLILIMAPSVRADIAELEPVCKSLNFDPAPSYKYDYTKNYWGYRNPEDYAQYTKALYERSGCGSYLIGQDTIGRQAKSDCVDYCKGAQDLIYYLRSFGQNFPLEDQWKEKFEQVCVSPLDNLPAPIAAYKKQASDITSTHQEKAATIHCEYCSSDVRYARHTQAVLERCSQVYKDWRANSRDLRRQGFGGELERAH
jgi:hypothetical protein